MRNKKMITGVVIIGGLILAIVLFNRTSKSTIHINAGNIDFSDAVVSQQIKQELDSDYEIGSKGGMSDKQAEIKAINFANKVTFLLLGAPGEGQVDYLEYKKREEEFNRITAEDAEDHRYQRVGIRYKKSRNPDVIRKNIRNRISDYKDYGKATVINISEDIVEVKVLIDQVTFIGINKDNPQEAEYISTRMELIYTLKNIYGEYRLKGIKYRVGNDLTDDIDESEEKEINSLRLNSVVKNSVDTKYNDEYDFSSLKEFSEGQQNQIFSNNIDNVVIVKAYNNYGVTNDATGFILSDGFVVTSYNFFEKALNNAESLAVIDNDINSYEIDGVVSIDNKLDVVILKLKEKKRCTIRIGNPAEIKKEDAILSIGTKTGYRLSMSTGIVAENSNNVFKNIMTIVESEEGSPVFNKKGEIIAINTSQSADSNFSVANSVNDLNDIKTKLDVSDFSSVKYISFSELKEKFYYNKQNGEIVVNQLSLKIWEEYKKIGNIEETIPLKLNKASFYDGIVSIRYENDISEYMTGMTRSYKFFNELKNSGYETIHESDVKRVYKNDKYKVTAMEELGYFIIIIKKE